MEIFKLFGSVMVNNDKANDSIKKTDDKASSLSTKFVGGCKTAAKWGAAIGGAAIAGATALYGVTAKATQAMDVIDKGSAKIGISKKGYQEWNYVLGQNGMSIDKLQVGMKTLVTKMDAVSKGNKGAAETFGKLGLSVKDSSGKLKSQEQMLNETLYSLANMKNGTEKARMATELFGKAGIEMMPMLNNGAEGMKELTKRSHELGLVVSDETVDAGVVLGDTMDDVKDSIGMVATKVGVSAIPIMQKFCDWIISNMPSIQMFIGGFFSGVQLFVEGFSNVLSFLFGSIYNNWDVIWAGIMNVWNMYGQPLFNMIASVVNTLYQTFVLVFPIIQSIFMNVWSICMSFWNSIGKPIFDTIMWVVQQVVTVFNQYFPSIALVVADAFNVIYSLYNTILQPVFTMIGFFLQNYLLPVFQAVFSTVISVVKFAFDGIMSLWNNSLKPIFTGIISFLQGIFTLDIKSVFNGVLSIIKGIWGGIKTIIMTPINAAISLIGGVVDTIASPFRKAKDIIDGIWKGIKGIFKLPHLTMKGSWNPMDWISGGLPKIGVEWYAKGGILNKPTAFGYNSVTGNAMVGGEAGEEAVAPISKLEEYFKKWSMSDQVVNVLEEIKERLSEDNLYRVFYRALSDGTLAIILDGREVGRIVKKYA